MNCPANLFLFICMLERKHGFALRKVDEDGWFTQLVPSYDVLVAIANFLDISVEEAVKNYILAHDWIVEKLNE